MPTTYKQINQLLADVYSDKKDRAIMDDFLEFAKNGQLDFYDIEVWKIPTRYIDALIYHGLFLDEMAESNHKRLHKALIEQGLATERYESWKNHPSKHVREALAKQGYYPDLYINDKSPDVRKHIIYQYPKQSLKRMHNHNDRFAIRWELVREPNPDLEVLSAFLETVTKSELKEAFALNDIEALRLKHQALITNPSPIEKTMAPYQLFEIHNPLWTLHYTAIAVFNITNAYDELEPEYKQMDNCVKLMFEIKDQLINAHASNLRAALRRRLGERN